MRGVAVQQSGFAAVPRARRCAVVASAAVATKTLKIGTRGSPLALAQAYLTRDLLKASAARAASSTFVPSGCLPARRASLHLASVPPPCWPSPPWTGPT